MPQRRTSYRTFVKNRVSRNRNQIGNKKTFRLTKAMKEEMGIELKFHDTGLSGSTINSTADMTNGEQNPSATLGVTTMAQGDGESNREGRRCTWQSLHITGIVNVTAKTNQTVAPAGLNWFIAVVLDTQTNGAFADSESVYNNPSANVRTSTTPLRNLQQIKRFRILATRKMKCDGNNMSFDGTNIEVSGCKRPFDIYIKFPGKGIVATYSGTTASIANSTDNSIIVLAWVSAVDSTSTITYNSRLRYYG